MHTYSEHQSKHFNPLTRYRCIDGQCIFNGKMAKYSPEALLVGSEPKVYFVISEYQLSTGLEPAHFALGFEDQEQYRFSPKSWLVRCSKES